MMRRRIVYGVTIIVISAAAMLFASQSSAQDLIVKSCPELIRMAETYQEDLKTVDTMLGSAIDAGNMDRIRNFKLKRGAVKKQLDSVMKAIDLKGCIRGR